MKKILLFAVATLTLFACSKEDDAPEDKLLTPNGQKSVFYATAEGTPAANTKVFADENYKVLWNKNDRLSVFNKKTINDQYAFLGEDGDTGGRFELVSGSNTTSGTGLEHVYGVYPYSENNQINSDDNKITVYLPSEQTYKENSFGIGANTMVAVTDDTYLPFRNVCGYLRFRFYGDDISISSITLEGNNGEKIAGKAVVTPVLGGNPTIEMDGTASGTITLNCPEPVTIGNSTTNYTDFIFVVPPITFSNGFKVCIVDELDRIFEKSSIQSLTIARNKIESMDIIKVTPSYIEFEDANFKAYCIANFDTDEDGEINYSEAQNVARIDVYTQNPDITSLKGIEVFKNLTYLKCGGRSSNSGKLTSLDVSNNKSLKTLWCYYNQLTSLNVSSCSALIDLDCSYNQLTSLDISNNTALTSLNCRSNKLTSLNVSNNIALQKIECTSNQLTSLDLSNNTALTTLYCIANQLSNLDVSNITTLRIITCQNNHMTSLNVSGCTSLTTLYCNENMLTSLDVSSNTALINLECYSNQMASLNVSKNTALKQLKCYSNQLTNLDVSNNIALTALLCSSNQLTSIDVSNNIALQNLSCSSNLITNLDVSNNTALTDLYCFSNQLTNLNVSNNTALLRLHCYSNQLTSLDVSLNTNLIFLYAWPQTGTLETLIKKRGQTISYNVTPSDYGTTIVEVD